MYIQNRCFIQESHFFLCTYKISRAEVRGRRCLCAGVMPLLHTFPMKSESSAHVCLIQKSMAEEQRVYCVPVGVVCLRNWVEENQWPPFCLLGKVRTTLIYEVFNLCGVCSGRMTGVLYVMISDVLIDVELAQDAGPSELCTQDEECGHQKNGGGGLSRTWWQAWMRLKQVTIFLTVDQCKPLLCPLKITPRGEWICHFLLTG